MRHVDRSSYQALGLKWLILFAVVLAVVWATSNAIAQPSDKKCFDVVVTEAPILGPILRDATEAMYESAGLCAEISSSNVGRGSQLMKRGLIDGETARTDYWLSAHDKQFVKVPTPMGAMRVFVLWRQDRFEEPKAFQDFKGAKVAVIRGFYWPQAVAERMGAVSVEALEVGQILPLLRKGRVDAILTEEWFLKFQLAGLPDAEKNQYSWMHLVDLPYYHIVGEQNAGSVSALDAALQRLGAPKAIMEQINRASAERLAACSVDLAMCIGTSN